MSNLLAQWYLDSFEVKIPEHQYTDEYFQFSSHWAMESMDYSTKILLPVVQQLLFTSHTLPKSDCTSIMLPTPASTDLEDLCVIWGGQFEGIELVNTCPVDNFITLLSLHSYQISEALRLSDVSPTNSLQTMLSHIEHQLGVQNVNMRYDFLGYEEAVVQLLTKLSLNSDWYKVIFQCWSCCYQSEKKLNLTFVLRFEGNCQNTIDNQIQSSFKCLKCRDSNANLESITQEYVQVSPLIILVVGHLTDASLIREINIENQIYFPHDKDILHYSLLGYTIHHGLHFSLRTKLQDDWYAYDGIERPKLKRVESNPTGPSLGRINCIVYVLSSRSSNS